MLFRSRYYQAMKYCVERMIKVGAAEIKNERAFDHRHADDPKLIVARQ
jgi:hypothetical protein